ncbi:MAG: outer membrane beta-barrel domain-containing protein [Cellvibrionaceae bacterium]
MHRPLQFLLIIFISTLLFSKASHAQSSNESDNPVLDKIITPDIERRTITEDQLDSEDWEIGIYNGIFSIEDFGTNGVTGLRAAYHMSEKFTLELNYAATEAKQSSIEVLGGGLPLATPDQRELTYYNVSVVYNVLPGEVFIGKKTSFNNTLYILAGAGNTTFFENDYFTVSIGIGTRFYLTDYLAIHATVKNHMFDFDVIKDKTTNNLEATLGLSFYF